MTGSVVTALTELGNTEGDQVLCVCCGAALLADKFRLGRVDLRNHIQVELSSSQLHNLGLECRREAVHH